MIPLLWTEAASAINAAIQKKIYRSDMTNLVLDESESWGIWFIGKSCQCGIEGRFLSVLMDTLSANFLVTMIAGKGFIRAGEGTITKVRIFNTTLFFN